MKSRMLQSPSHPASDNLGLDTHPSFPAASSSSAIDAQPSDAYRGFIGLNTHALEFHRHVMMPEEVMAFLGAGIRYGVEFIYPRVAADSFQSPITFSGENVTGSTFTLKENVISNKHPHSLSGWFARFFVLPNIFIIENHIEFVENHEQGFGRGSFLVRSMNCRYPDGKKASLAQAVIAADNRPGLFLKVARDDVFYDDVAIYFPDRVEGFTHGAVQFGEAFVLVREGVVMTPKLVFDINAAFNELVRKSYGDQGLFHIGTIQSIEAFAEGLSTTLQPQ